MNYNIKMKDFFPESLDQKCGSTLYMAKYSNSSKLEVTASAFSVAGRKGESWLWLMRGPPGPKVAEGSRGQGRVQLNLGARQIKPDLGQGQPPQLVLKPQQGPPSHAHR